MSDVEDSAEEPPACLAARSVLSKVLSYNFPLESPHASLRDGWVVWVGVGC